MTTANDLPGARARGIAAFAGMQAESLEQRMANNEADDRTGAGEPPGQQGEMTERKANRLLEAERRKARAAEKLRENLLRRKQQVRARRAGEAETGTGLPTGKPETETGND